MSSTDHLAGDFVFELLSFFSPSDVGLVLDDGGREEALALAKALPADERDQAAIEVLATMVKMARLSRGSSAADAAIDVLGAVVFELYGRELAEALLTPVLPTTALARITGTPAPRLTSSAPLPAGATIDDDDDLYARLLG